MATTNEVMDNVRRDRTIIAVAPHLPSTIDDRDSDDGGAAVATLQNNRKRVDAMRRWIFDARRRHADVAVTIGRLFHIENGFTHGEKIADVVNRSSVKLAEMDAIANIVPRHKNLNFLDLCCAPGGFLDYIFLRKRWSATGAGVSLDERYGGLRMLPAGRLAADDAFVFRCDIKEIASRLEDLSCESEVVAYLRSKRRKVSLVMADGAMVEEARRCDNHHELVLAQWSLARYTLRRNGCFLLKTFGWYDPDGSDNLVGRAVREEIGPYFRELVILKSWHSRITNDERYLLFRTFSPFAQHHGRRSFASPPLLSAHSTARAMFRAEFVISTHQVCAYERIVGATIELLRHRLRWQRPFRVQRGAARVVEERYFTLNEMLDYATDRNKVKFAEVDDALRSYCKTRLRLPVFSPSFRKYRRGGRGCWWMRNCPSREFHKIRNHR